MDLEKKYKVQAFDFMRKMSQLNKNEIKKHFSKRNAKYIKIVYWELLGDICDIDEISAFKFSKIVLKLYNTEKEWAKKLEAIIIFANQNAKNEGKTKAVQVTKKFIIECPSPLFKEIALKWFEWIIRQDRTRKA